MQAPMAARAALRMGPSWEKTSVAEESVRRWLPGRITESKACFARTPAPPAAQMRAAQFPCTCLVHRACHGPNRESRAARSKSRNARAVRRCGEDTQQASCAASAEGRKKTDFCWCGSYCGQATNQLTASRCEAVGMTRRNAVLSGYPLGFEQRKFGEEHENWVERAGLESCFAA